MVQEGAKVGVFTPQHSREFLGALTRFAEQSYQLLHVRGPVVVCACVRVCVCVCVYVIASEHSFPTSHPTSPFLFTLLHPYPSKLIVCRVMADRVTPPPPRSILYT